ncbi:hypothetical protein ACVR1G_01140 [Streptococcus dentasini]
MSQSSKNIFQRVIVILTLLASIVLFAFIVMNVWHIQQVATRIGFHFTASKGKLVQLDDSVQQFVWWVSAWIVLQLLFFLGLLIHFFKATKNEDVSGSRRVDDAPSRERETSRHRRQAYEDEDENEEVDYAFSESENTREEISSQARETVIDSEAEESESLLVEEEEAADYRQGRRSERYSADTEELEIPRPVGRRSRRDRR